MGPLVLNIADVRHTINVARAQAADDTLSRDDRDAAYQAATSTRTALAAALTELAEHAQVRLEACAAIMERTDIPESDTFRAGDMRDAYEAIAADLRRAAAEAAAEAISDPAADAL